MRSSARNYNTFTHSESQTKEPQDRWSQLGYDRNRSTARNVLETFREESINVKLKLLNVDRLTANVFHMWSWAFSCFKMLNTSSPSGSWSNCNSITCTRRNYSVMLFTVKIKCQMITLPHLLCLEEGFQWKSPCLRLFEPAVRSEVVQWEWGVLGNT